MTASWMAGLHSRTKLARSIADALKIKFAVRLSAHERPGNGGYDGYLRGLFTDVTDPTGVSRIGASVPVQNPSDPFTVPDYTPAGGFDPLQPDTSVTPAPPGTGFTTSVRDRALEAGPRTNKITADVIAAPPEMAFNASVRDRALEAGLRTNKIRTDVTATPPETGFNTSVRDRALEAGLRTNKITADVTATPPETGFNTSVRDRALEAGLRTNKITADVTAAPPGRDPTPVCVIAHWKPVSERTKLLRTGQRPSRGLSKMQKANRLKAQTFGSNPETANRCSAH